MTVVNQRPQQRKKKLILQYLCSKMLRAIMSISRFFIKDFHLVEEMYTLNIVRNTFYGW